MIANLFLHYVFDAWMAREFPGCPFERDADDAIVHCRTEKQAWEVRMVTVTIGRSAPAELVEAAKRYIQVPGSTISPYELALAAHDD